MRCEKENSVSLRTVTGPVQFPRADAEPNVHKKHSGRPSATRYHVLCDFMPAESLSRTRGSASVFAPSNDSRKRHAAYVVDVSAISVRMQIFAPVPVATVHGEIRLKTQNGHTGPFNRPQHKHGHRRKYLLKT